MSNATIEKKALSAQEVINVIHDLSRSQGYYGRLLEAILEAQDENPAAYAAFCGEMEAQAFKDPLDIVFYFEC